MKGLDFMKNEQADLKKLLHIAQRKNDRKYETEVKKHR